MQHVHTEGVRHGGCIGDVLPAVETVVHVGGCRKHDDERNARLHVADGRVRSPDRPPRNDAFAAIPPPYGLRAIEGTSERSRGDQLHELRMGPGERHGRSGRLPEFQSPCGYRWGIPDLLGQHAAG